MAERCWCGSEKLQDFGAGYCLCTSCGTLVCRASLPESRAAEGGDAAGLGYYAREYWFEHQQQNLGLPSLAERARQDLTERGLHWLAALLRYRQPPAKVMELGCGHGGFVALMQQAGYDASGVEMSPTIVAYAQDIFGVPVQLGPVESLNLPAGGIDVIVMMDVLEHLPNPLDTLQHCSRLLAEDGLLLIQTPEYMAGRSYEHLQQEHARFLSMMIPVEHLFLYNRTSVSKLLAQVGLPHVSFDEAIFSHYDMFLVAGKHALQAQDQKVVEEALLATPEGRLVLAMLDLRARELALNERLIESEADRAARLVRILNLERWLMEARGEAKGRGADADVNGRP